MAIRPASFVQASSIVAWLACGLVARPTLAQLQITELMNDPRDENAWEWLEVRNAGPTPVDLNGYIIDRVGDAQSTATMIDGALSANTVVPAGGVAVIYNAELTGPGDYDDQAFRNAWSLSPSVPLIGAPGFGPSLTNTPGTAIGFWADATSYSADVADDGMGTMRVAQLNNAAFGLDFREASGFLRTQNGYSSTWNGQGSYQDPFAWNLSQPGVDGAVQSVATSIAGAQINSTDDIANPGKLPLGARAAGVLITEIMYDPASPAVGSVERWEWVEILNNTPAAINFAATPYFLHDNDGADLTAGNVTTGVLPVGGVAVLFNDAISTQNMLDAWGDGAPANTLFIPVANFPALANGGDTIALWDSLADYHADSFNVSGRLTANAAAAVNFDDAGSSNSPTGWPNGNGRRSIYLSDLASDANVGQNWAASASSDAIGSFNADEAFATAQIHAGGDVGSPGAFGTVAPTDADFDNDGDVDGRDLLVWQRNLGTGSSNATGDANGSGTVDAADLAIWRAQFQASAQSVVGIVPEPACLVLALLGIGGRSIARRPSAI